MSNELKEALHESNKEICYLPANYTDLCQTAGLFIIQKLTAAWRATWDLKRMEMASENQWICKNGSGKLPNHGKRFFLELASQVVREVNTKSDDEGII